MINVLDFGGFLRVTYLFPSFRHALGQKCTNGLAECAVSYSSLRDLYKYASKQSPLGELIYHTAGALHQTVSKLCPDFYFLPLETVLDEASVCL